MGRKLLDNDVVSKHNDSCYYCYSTKSNYREQFHRNWFCGSVSTCTPLESIMHKQTGDVNKTCNSRPKPGLRHFEERCITTRIQSCAGDTSGRNINIYIHAALERAISTIKVKLRCHRTNVSNNVSMVETLNILNRSLL